MKKLLLLAFLAVGMSAYAQEEKTVEINDGGIKLADDSNWKMHLYVGLDIPTGVPDGVDFAPFRSWEIGLTVAQYEYTPKNSKTTLSAGFGVDWRNYTLSGHDKMFIKNANDIVGVYDRKGDVSELASRISTTSLSLPLMVKQSFSKDFAVSLGAQLNWNFYSRVNNYYEMGDDEIDVQTKKIGERPITVDVLGMLHFGDFAVYCKYSPMSVLKKDKGPDFKSLAVGFYF
jgi:hypothetical protein